MGKLLYFDDDKAELFPVLNEIFRTRTTAEWIEVLRAAGIRYAPVRDHAEIIADPDSWENGYLSESADGETRYVRVPVTFSDSDTVESDTPAGARRAHVRDARRARLQRRGDRRTGRRRRDLTAGHPRRYCPPLVRGGRVAMVLIVAAAGARADESCSRRNPSAAARATDLVHHVPRTDPARLLDTRAGYATIDGQFQGAGQIAPMPGISLGLQVAGRGGVPASGVGAVAVNVTVTGSSRTGLPVAVAGDLRRPRPLPEVSTLLDQLGRRPDGGEHGHRPVGRRHAAHRHVLPDRRHRRRPRLVPAGTERLGTDAGPAARHPAGLADRRRAIRRHRLDRRWAGARPARDRTRRRAQRAASVRSPSTSPSTIPRRPRSSPSTRTARRSRTRRTSTSSPGRPSPT